MTTWVAIAVADDNTPLDLPVKRLSLKLKLKEQAQAAFWVIDSKEEQSLQGYCALSYERNAIPYSKLYPNVAVKSWVAKETHAEISSVNAIQHENASLDVSATYGCLHQWLMNASVGWQNV